LAKLLRNEGKSVLIAAGDTFRAAAIEQLQVWADRAGVDLIKQQEGSDPASVIFDAIAAQKSREIDVLLCDSAGRLHNKKNLMRELEKITRIIGREYPREDVRTLLVLDSTTGQNALNQAVLFKEYADMDGIILTKLDGSAKGGFVFSIKEKLGVPVLFVATGEKIEDMAPFDAQSFVAGIFSEE
jgi:fused signal recognition particle receptor